MNRAMRRAAVSTRRMKDRRVRRIDQFKYLHTTKGIKPVRRYVRIQEERQVVGALLDTE